MKRCVLVVLGALLCLSSVVWASEDGGRLGMYPLPEAGYQRMVIELPAVVDEQDHEVELQVGKMMKIDCNSFFFTGKMVRKSIDGWGYPYEVVSNIQGPISTRMACPPGQTEKAGFVPLLLDEAKRRYNSRLPLVIYVPDGFEVRYRLWSTSGPAFNAIVQ